MWRNEILNRKKNCILDGLVFNESTENLWLVDNSNDFDWKGFFLRTFWKINFCNVTAIIQINQYFGSAWWQNRMYRISLKDFVPTAFRSKSCYFRETEKNNWHRNYSILLLLLYKMCFGLTLNKYFFLFCKQIFQQWVNWVDSFSSNQTIWRHLCSKICQYHVFLFTRNLG